MVQYVEKYSKITEVLTNLLMKAKAILDTKSVGLLVSQRMLNVPHQLVLPLYRSILSNMEILVEDERVRREGMKKVVGVVEREKY